MPDQFEQPQRSPLREAAEAELQRRQTLKRKIEVEHVVTDRRVIEEIFRQDAQNQGAPA